MRIIDDRSRRDYYDSVKSVAFDANVLYVRTEQEIPLETIKTRKPHFEHLRRDFAKWNPDGADYHRGISVIGFCGKIYPFVWYDGIVKECFYDLDAFFDFYKKNCSDEEKSNRKYRHRNRFWSPFGDMKKTYRVAFEFYSRSIKDLTDIFPNYKCPIFLIERYDQWEYPFKLLINPMLKNYSFFKVFDTYSAFQEIYQYQSNIAEERKIIPTCSDEMKIATHGFNKWSFRRPAVGE